MSTTDENMKIATYKMAHAKIDKFYQNSKNNIEDPLFTGFTFDIDTLNSPLFFALCEKEYVESLRSSGGGDVSWAKEIENKLANAYKFHIKSNPHSYEINTISTKDELGTHMAGYGLQEKHYIDQPLYGAVDYIYMVDKVSESKYVDETGVSELGGGMSTNIYKETAKAIDSIVANRSAEQEFFANYTSQTAEGDQAGQQAAKEDSGDSDVDDGDKKNMSKKDIIQESIKGYEKVQEATKEEHKKNEQDYEKVKVKYDEAAAAVNELQARLQNLTTNFDNCKIAIERAVSDAVSAADTYIKNLSSDSAEKEVNNAYNKLCDLLFGSVPTISDVIQKMSNEIKRDYTYESTSEEGKSEKLSLNYTVKFKCPTVNDINSSLNNQSSTNNEDGSTENTTENTTANTTSIDSPKGRAYFLLGLKIEQPIKSSEVENSIQTVKKHMEEFNDDLYGKGGTRDSYHKDSPYGVMMEAKNKMENDTWSDAQRAIDGRKQLLENYEDSQAYMASVGDSVTTGTQKNASMDISISEEDLARKDGEEPAEYLKRIEGLTQKDSTRQIFEVPQTVYDMMGFIHGMKDITTKYPYVLQTVTGLDEAYKSYFEVKDPYMGSGENVITIECLEFLDLKVSSMFNKYFNAVYDRQYRRERVPINLRRFNCSIFVHDIRNFKDALNGGQYGTDLKPLVEMALNYVSAIEFKFFDCEFVPKETGGIFNTVSNSNTGDMAKTQFTFTYGNCVINFLPFEDLKRYLFNQTENGVEKIQPKKEPDTNHAISDFSEDQEKVTSRNAIKELNKELTDTTLKSSTFDDLTSEIDDGNFRRWFDRSELGNVNNNDYRDYVRRDSAVAVDDYYKSTMVDSFALNSVVNKNKELTALDDALRRIVVGISASTGIPVKGVTDALEIQFIDPILNQKDLDTPVVRKIGNVYNSKIIDTDTTEFIGSVHKYRKDESGFIDFLGNVNENKKKGGN